MSTSAVIPYIRWFKISDCVVWTLPKEGYAICYFTRPMKAGRSGKSVSIVLKAFPFHITFTPVHVRNLLSCDVPCLDEKSTWTFETRNYSLYLTSRLLRPVKSWWLEENNFSRANLVGSEYTAIFDDKHATVHFVSFLEIPRYRPCNNSTKNIKDLSFGHILLVKDKIASIPSWLGKKYFCNAVHCLRVPRGEVFCTLLYSITCSSRNALYLCTHCT